MFYDCLFLGVIDLCAAIRNVVMIFVIYFILTIVYVLITNNFIFLIRLLLWNIKSNFIKAFDFCESYEVNYSFKHAYVG